MKREVRRGHPGRRKITPYALIAVPILIYTLFAFLPLLLTVILSFFEWNGLTTPTFTGLTNYITTLTESTFTPALLHNLQFIVFYTGLPIMIGLLLAAVLTQRQKIHALPTFRFILFLPYVTTTVVIGIVWRWIYSPVNGPINGVLGLFGIGPFPFLGNTTAALPSVAMIGTWSLYGLVMVFFIAGIQKIDRDLYDSVAVDGGGSWHSFRHVTLPGLRSEIVVAAILTTSTALRAFDVVFVTTRGGPAATTDVAGLWIYRTAFNQRQVGLGAAAATILVAAIYLLAYLVLKLGEERR